MFTRWVVLTFLVIGAPKPSVSRGIENPTYCEFYNEACASTPQGCPKKVKCLSDHPDARSHCFATWLLDEATNVTTVKQKGCFLDGKRCENRTLCADDNGRREKDVFFCCCTGDMCNENFTWTAKLTEQPRVAGEEATTKEAEEPEEKAKGPEEPDVSDESEPEESTESDDYGHEEPKSTKEPEKSEPSAQENSEWAIIEFFLYVPALVLITIGSVYWFVKLAKRHWCSHPISEPRAEAITLLRVKARGNFGAVWKARMGKKIVAVKICSVQNHSCWRTERQVFTLPHMSHENLLEFFGADRSVASLLNELWLITAYHPRGSLGDCLKTMVLSLSEVLKIATSILRGLKHLHEEIPSTKTAECKPSVAHRDVKSQNVLLKIDMTACLADFGLSAIFYPNKSSGTRRSRVGTRRYMAPELLQGSVEFNRETYLPIDMYACSFVLWELVSRCSSDEAGVGKYKLPFEDLVGLQPTTDDMVKTVVLNKQRPVILPTWRNNPELGHFCNVIEKCWDADPAFRLTSSDALDKILALNDFHGESSSTVIVIEEDQGSSAIEDTT